ncbi:MAG: dynamin family protein [Aphanothece sp. CMT-3BRIN-NPC111]|jgi:GTPase SAR1 family protein|nr:dynamin family protein [Aphanothece sp. CMT-3BRIN-NPC111]
MESEALKPNLQDLQANVVDLLLQVSSLMHRASAAFSLDSGSDRFAKIEQEVSNAARNVKDFELRMAIVAPMKAGKSTIINAIVGQDLLPSRNAAMTTIPTEIIFDAGRTEPTLTMSPEIREVFRETFFTLQRQIRELGISTVREKLGQYPHLVKLAERIEAKPGGAIDEEVVGRQRIINNLGALNDIVRLCSILEPLADPLESLTDVPRIYTPFWLSSLDEGNFSGEGKQRPLAASPSVSEAESPKTEQSNLLGNLVIVDTPGPNEAGDNLRLVKVVSDQLEKCSLVLIVLDFTQLRTEAAEKVKKDVQRAIELRGKDNLYILINKVDQRREGDMTPEQVQQYVAAELGIGDTGETNRVFEIAARRAFCAASFMQDIEQHPDNTVLQSPAARSLAQEVFGIDWEEELESATVEDLQKKAQRLWKKSGFAPFLENAVQALIAEAAPRCMISALNTARGRLVELQEDVQLRSRAIYEDEEKLRLEVVALEDDLHNIELCRTRLQEVEQIKTKLYQELNNILGTLQKEAKLTIESYFNEEEYSKIDLTPKNGKEANSLAKWIKHNIKSPLDLKGKGIVEFKTLREAEEFADIAVSYPQTRANLLLENIRDKMGQQIEQSREALTYILERDTKPIIERARDRLNQSFNVDLSLPKLSLESGGIDFNKPRVKRHTKILNRGYEEKVVIKRTWWHWLGLIPKKETIQVRIPEHREAYYSVSLQGIVTEVNQLIEQSIKSIKQGITEYLDEDFQQRVDVFFDELDTYLSNYCDSLRQAQSDQKLSLEQKEILVRELRALVPEAIAQIKQVDTYLEFINQWRMNSEQNNS